MRTNFNFPLVTILAASILFISAQVQAFTTPVTSHITSTPFSTTTVQTPTTGRVRFALGLVPNHSATPPSASTTELYSSSDSSSVNDASEIVGRRILVKGDVNGGYVRTCVINEASRFRKLIGTMSPPEDTDTAEIYVEGKRSNVEGFIRWCGRGTKSVGLSQKLEVVEITEEDPTGLYDGFYAKTGRQ
eukprot:CAMPEP_0198253472 /NCGR_PEP_ID=MMETSP1447-20131203/3882_1 /TAXON_ID=420782 /ORGANISM="Chaetoceros dichaeta, Strain CCMP1751" /LENGTH=188 /DNA_ID=CAMNT_0043939149 /DNA_START=96 /DNA_END=662 /DNA_ORIENTATION=+